MQATAEWLDVDYYDVLGLDQTATAKQIKSAYRKLARTAHPDANPDDPTAEARFSDIAKAYEVLSDQDTRAEYDELRTQAARRPRGGGWSSADRGFGSQGFGGRSSYGATGFDGDFVDLGDLFGEMFAEQQSRPRRGADLSASLTIDFVDAVQGMTTTLTLDGQDMRVRIPAGVEDGQTIRLAGRGLPGANGGSAGDLLIEVGLRPHPRFGRQGDHLTVTVPVPYEDAVLGGAITVPTLDGDSVTVRIPAGTSPGRKLRVRGKGVQRQANVGDLLVEVTIDVPDRPTEAERAALEQLRATRTNAD